MLGIFLTPESSSYLQVLGGSSMVQVTLTDAGQEYQDHGGSGETFISLFNDNTLIIT